MKKTLTSLVLFLILLNPLSADDRSIKLDNLFNKLKIENSDKVFEIEQEIWKIWSTHPSNNKLTNLLGTGSNYVNNNQFSKAVFFANSGTMIFVNRTEQLMAEACKRLIKNAIICWNFLYLTACIQQAKTLEAKQAILQSMKSGSAMTWQHIYFHGLYDFSEENLADDFNFDQINHYQKELDAILKDLK